MSAAAETGSSTRDVQNFDGVALSIRVELILTQGDRESLTIEASSADLALISTEVPAANAAHRHQLVGVDRHRVAGGEGAGREHLVLGPSLGVGLPPSMARPTSVHPWTRP